MKNLCLQKTIIAFAITLISINIANAKVWRINNTPGITADFTQAEAALNSTTAGKIVANDDTLYLEGSATAYDILNLDKRVVIIGPGYLLGTALPNNIGLQANPNSARITIAHSSAGSGSTLIGLDIQTLGVNSGLSGSDTDNISVLRCKVDNFGQYFSFTTGGVFSNWKFNKCYIGNFNVSIKLENLEITNCIFTGGLTANFAGNNILLVRNNVIRSTVDINNAYFANNLITTSFTGINTTVKNNIATGASTLPTGNGNLNGQPDTNVFVGLSGNSTDGQWKLKAGSPAIGAGENIGGIMPDCGPFGTADPYLLSGIPPIPTIYALTIPANTATNQLPITISTKSNN